MKSKVMTIANKLVGQGWNRAEAMLKAWVLVKMQTVETNVAGVTFDNRQALLDRLTAYPADMVSIELQRDKGNQYDKNAIAVVAKVQGKGQAIIGYIPRKLALFIAPLMDCGKSVQGIYKTVCGNIYSHAIKSADAAAAEVLQDVLKPKGSNPNSQKQA